MRGPGEVEIEADGYSEAQVRRLLDASPSMRRRIDQGLDENRTEPYLG